MKRLVVSALVVILAPHVVLNGHHSFAAEFDSDKPHSISGVVTKVEWTNPHIRLFIEVRDPSNSKTIWEVELGSVNSSMRNGMTRHDIKAGDVVTISGFLARITPNLVGASTPGTSVGYADGRKYLAGTGVVPAPAK